MDWLLNDLKHTIRLLARDRGFSVTATLTLALVIGANVAIFSVINAVLLRPLPLEGAGDLVRVFNSYPNAGVPRASNSAPDFFDRRSGVAAFEEVAVARGSDHALEMNGVPTRVSGLQATPSLFTLLRATPELGRCFTEDEGELGNERRVVLSHTLWQKLYGGDPGAIGEDLRLDGVPYRVVGVMPEKFFFLNPRVQLWTPQAFSEEQQQAYHDNDWSMFARLAPGASIEQARAQIDAINARQLEANPQLKQVLVDAGFHTCVVALQEDLVRNVRSSFYLLWAGVLFVLLIGCVNVANLALVRASVRVKELAMRSALGAGRARLARQLITESLLLTTAGAVLGIGVGWAGVRALVLLGIEQLPRGVEVGIDSTVLLLTLAAALAIGVLLGLIPVAHMARPDTSVVLRDEGRGTTVGRGARVARGGLVTVQVATAFVLLIGAGLLLSSFRKVLAIDPGFETEGVLTASVMLPDARYPTSGDITAFSRRALDAIRALPGVEAASLTSTIPFGESYSDAVILAEGYQMRPGESVVSPSRIVVAPGTFETLGIPLVEGRFFDERDGEEAPRTVIVDQKLAARFWPGKSPLGKRMYRPSSPEDLLATDDSTEWLSVVGVVGTVKFRDLLDDDDRAGTYYFPLEQSSRSSLGFVIKAAGDPRLIIEPVRRTLAAIDSELPLFDAMPLGDRISESLVVRRSPMVLALVFAGMALFLAAVGLYGVLAYLVSQRTREIGIRMALGSSPGAIFQLIMTEGVIIVAAGLVVGLVLTVLMRSVLAGHLYGVGPLDPAVLAVVGALLTVAAGVACSLPSLRAARVYPAVVLKE